MAEATGRPQDQGRRHRRKGTPSPETSSLLRDWHETMRAELRAIVEALSERAKGLLPDVPASFVIPLEDARRDRLVDRGIKVGRELGGEVDASPATAPNAPAGGPKRGRVAFGPDK